MTLITPKSNNRGKIFFKLESFNSKDSNSNSRSCQSQQLGSKFLFFDSVKESGIDLSIEDK